MHQKIQTPMAENHQSDQPSCPPLAETSQASAAAVSDQTSDMNSPCDQGFTPAVRYLTPCWKSTVVETGRSTPTAVKMKYSKSLASEATRKTHSGA